jgi:hypothetical protein
MKKSGKTFSVLTVSRRKGWALMAASSIAKQTTQPDGWIVVHESVPDLLSEIRFSTSPALDKLKFLAAPEHTRPSNLNASLNEGLRHIDTDYVIFYQDFIELPEDCFEKLLNLADEHTFVTTCTPNYDGSNDGRYTGVDVPRPCRPNEWEANVAIAPMGVVRELGGFDEEYDNGWSWDNCNLAERAEILGAKFICDESNRPKLYPHDMSSHSLPPNGDLHYETMKKIRRGEKPLRLGYLDGVRNQ